MKAESHVLIGCSTWFAVSAHPLNLPLHMPTLASNPELAVLSLVPVLIGSLLPDIDHPKSKVARRSLGKKGTLMSHVRPLQPVAYGVNRLFGHRGAMHSALAVIVVVWLLTYVGVSTYLIGLAWGYTLHLAADMLTIRGIPLLWPITNDSFGLPEPLAITTGSFGETVYLLLIAAGCALVAFGYGLR